MAHAARTVGPVSTATRANPRVVKAALMVVIVAGAWAAMALVAKRLVSDDAPEHTLPAQADQTPPTQALREQLLHTTWQELGIRPRDVRAIESLALRKLRAAPEAESLAA